MRINCLLQGSVVRGLIPEDFAKELATQMAPDAQLDVHLGPADFQTVPDDGYIVADTDFQFASGWLDERDYPRLFLLEAEMDPVILEALETYGMPGAISIVTWSRVTSLSDPFYPLLRNEVAESFGFERIAGFPSPNYSRYKTNLPLPTFLVRYLAAFDEWKSETFPADRAAES